MAETASVSEQLNSTNTADLLDNEVLDKIGCDVVERYEIDKRSRSEWEQRNDTYIKLASQVKETRKFPWPKSANIKYPLLSIASLQFASRAYQNLIPGPNVVKARTIGADPNQFKREAAGRISRHMSYQILEQIPGWEDDMDVLCLLLPIVGTAFKKTYRIPGETISELVLPQDLVVNYYAKSIERASRKTQLLEYYPHEVEEKFLTEEFSDTFKEDILKSEPPQQAKHKVKEDVHGQKEPDVDPDTPHQFIEQHTFWDLDNDGYREPVIITVHLQTEKVVRIRPRFRQHGVKINEDGNIKKITPIEYFTCFRFIPDTTSGVYGQGFGSLLGPLNESANTIFNQLIDAGTLSNLPSGFLARGIRLPHGNTPLRPGEWRHLNVIGEDLQKGIFPLPIQEPSTVLLNLLGMVIDSGQMLSSVSDTMAGKNPGQNQPYSTTSDLLQQGLQVFSSIYKRVHRSLGKEFKKIYALNKEYVQPIEYFNILDSDPQEVGQVHRTDYVSFDTDVIPASDPSLVTSAEKLQKAEALLAFTNLGTVNPMVATRKVLEAQGQEDIAELMQLPEPQPDPELEIKKFEAEMKAQHMMGTLSVDAAKAEAQIGRDRANTMLAFAKAEAEGDRVEIEKLKAEADAYYKAALTKVKEQENIIKAKIEQFKATQISNKKEAKKSDDN